VNEDELRTALEAAASQVEPDPHGLAKIRMRTAARRRRARVLWWPVLATAAAAAVAVAVVAVPRHQGPPPRPTATVVDPVPSETPLPQGTVNVPVYFVGNTGLGPRLFREYHVVTATPASPEDKASVALAEMFKSPVDPDYRTLWPSGATVRSVVAQPDGTDTVDLAGVSGPGPADPQLAVEQLVWTVTAATGRSTPYPVRLTIDGQPAGELWGLWIGDRTFTRSRIADVRSPVWLIDPAEGATITAGKPVNVYVAGLVADGALKLRVRQGDKVVEDRPVQLDHAAPQAGEARLPLTLSPGEYTIEAYVPAEDGGADLAVDSHRVTVR